MLIGTALYIFLIGIIIRVIHNSKKMEENARKAQDKVNGQSNL